MERGWDGAWGNAQFNAAVELILFSTASIFLQVQTSNPNFKLHFKLISCKKISLKTCRKASNINKVVPARRVSFLLPE